ncbi:hypothetical protein BST81_01735 [Leptolyngbya sp. 'hensonii']|uniref:tetratricopeptide repeat protein n=1 Tax=Leptolyngbya sp. 'hensonii' TaxID=1922337 RepID=UPI00094F4AC3|nr:tetratricopeptide repeat protein [Leptolyngbya sp. 'hensonii']OLP20177.1 hypothetical protein BST81_01735 [Leptolyngbya sp. 'hensonii']
MKPSFISHLATITLVGSFLGLGQGVLLAQSQPGGLSTLPDFDYWADRCRTLAQADQLEQAIPACEQAIALRSGDKTLWILYADVLYRLGRYGEAAAAAKSALRYDDRNSEALTSRCRALLAIHQYEAAIAACAQALEVNENWGTLTPKLAWFKQGLALVRVGRAAAGIKAYDESLKLDPRQSGVLTHRCQALLQLETFEAAIGDCRQALDVDAQWGGQSPKSAWNAQGSALQMLKRLEEAVFAYDQSLRLDAKQPIIWAKQGLILRELDRDADALVAFTQAVQSKPDYTLALVNQCTLLNQFGQYDAALRACEAAIRGDGSWGPLGPAQGWDQQANALAGLRRLEEALASAERAVNMAPDYPTAWNNRGVILWSLQRYDDALTSVDRALELRQDYARAWFNRGRILRELGRYAAAARAYDEVIRLEPENALAWANQSAVLWQMKRYDLALRAADAAIDRQPSLALAWYNRGTALSSQGRYSEAISAFDRALELTPTDTGSLTGKGLSLVAIGEDEAAVPVLQQALRLNPNQILAQENLKQAAKRILLRQKEEQERKRQEQMKK